MAIKKVTDPNKKATDPCLLAHLKKEKIDKDYVEFTQDYAARGPGRSPYTKRYRDRKSGKCFLVCSGLPMCRQDGTKLTPGWERKSGKFHAKTNLFTGTVEDNGRIALAPTNKQPNGMRTSDTLAWRPQLYLDNIEVFPVSGPALLPVDPINPNLTDNTLEWDYGICKRRIRTIQGRLRERWIFTESPGADVRLIHNHTGKGLQLGSFAIDDDVEFIPLAVFQQAEYPFEVSASATFYPDAHEETSSVDGQVVQQTLNTPFLTLQADVGNIANDTNADSYPVYIGTSGTDYYQINRGIFVFDISSLSPCIITSATKSVYGTGKCQDIGIDPDIDVNLYSSAPASNTELVAGDYDSLDTVPFCDTAITYGAYNAAGWNSWAMNAAGITFLQAAADGDGIVKLGLRNANYDAAGVAPDEFQASVADWFKCYFADQGSDKPKLVIEYYPHVSGSISVSVEPGATLSQNLIMPLSVSVEPGASGNFNLVSPLSVSVEPGASGTFLAGILGSISVSVEPGATLSQNLIMPLSVSVEPGASGNFNLISPLSVSVEPGASGTFLAGILGSISVSVEPGASGNFNLVSPLSVSVEPGASLSLNIMYFTKSDVLINIWNAESQVN